MNKSRSGPMLWAPKHSGWNLAHHLLASFVLLAFLAGSGTYALLNHSPVLSTALLATAAAVLTGVVAAFRRSTADRPAANSAVITTTGPRAATWFPMFRTSAKWAALVMGLSVVILVATVALSARLLIIHNYEPILLVIGLGCLLLVAGIYVLNRGIRMARLAAMSQNPGVYLTRSRIVLYGSRGAREIYWNDVVKIEAADPPGRRPLGKRGPAWIVVRSRSEDSAPGTRLVITIHELAANPDQLLATLEHYWSTAAHRAELGTDDALYRVEEFPTCSRDAPGQRS